MFLLSLFLGLMFINAGLNKFLNYKPAPKDLPGKMQKLSAAFMEIGWFMPFAGFAEILRGIPLCHPKNKSISVIVIFPVIDMLLIKCMAET
jgi:hypothetical protein